MNPVSTAPQRLDDETLDVSRERIRDLKRNLESVIQGKPEAIDVLIVALVANGSVLLDDVPGVGKTTLAKALAASIDAQFRRIQFTPDLLPADILGSSIYSQKDGSFTFRKGPIFCNILLADEINRASPRTQSALLEAMSESQATVEGERYPLPAPFMVIATENPVEFHGTYPLPEAQLDRFLCMLSLGYPSPESEVDILYAQADHHPLEDVRSVVKRQDVIRLQSLARHARVERTVARYIIEIVGRTRSDPRLKLGVSPRGALMLFRASQVAAFAEGRNHVTPDDIQRLAVPVLAHRIMITPKAKYEGVTKQGVIEELLRTVPAPA